MGDGKDCLPGMRAVEASMPGKSTLTADAAEQAALRALSKSEQRGEADRARAILLTLEGRKAEEIAARGPLCPGIDPHPALLTAWGLTVDADGLARFSDICVEAFSGFAIVKPQVAFFEAYGAAGFAVLEHTIRALRDAGVLVLADAKRGDIGSTMAAYADAWVGDSPLAADAVTASPYLGF